MTGIDSIFYSKPTTSHIRFANDTSLPMIDATNNLMNTSLDFTNGQITLRFLRELVTSDISGQDVSLNVSRVWIWAIGNITDDDPPVIDIHTNRGLLNNGNPIALPTTCIGMTL